MKKFKVIILIVIFFIQMFSFTNACTIFMGVSKDKVFVGNNEDFIDPNTYLWFLPEEENKYGRVYFGFGTELPQGGMNEKGLFFDCTSVPPRIGKYFNKKNTYKGNLMKLALESCSNVLEVIELFNKYDRSYMTYQIFFADKNGNSVIIETDTIIVKMNNYQIASNYCQSLPIGKNVNPTAMLRYQIADSMLSSTNNYTIDYFKKILDATHQEGNSPTQYSNIYDLSNGDIYVYLFHNYKDYYRLNLFDELKKGNQVYKLSSLIKPSNAYKNFVNKYHAGNYTITQIDTSLYAKYIGEYSINNFPPAKYYVSKNNGTLHMMASGFDNYPLEPISENEFFMKEMNMHVTFNRGENNLVNSISISIYNLINLNASRDN